ncbi:uroporphyrinogen-III synthase [Sulfuriferula multivorans]|uniref:Uroporphyrinogen-III synthase n=1 Tax=Sulfuriferula multivorans TaxID=1559896 RepID=A0A401JGM3_9PROT|nr:uroporphyrinogen-III synthase [Sulfuriferula multivorans]GBL46743.1 uroporphyrinogen-III synthase [Sulfuriferula multivorans]
MNTSLNGRGVLVTRPAHQAAHLAELIIAAAGKPVLFPVLEILDAADLQPLYELIDRLDSVDLAIFISPNAVNKAMNLIKSRRELPPSLKIAAIGRGSSKELKHFGITDIIAPTARFDSENLLEMPELQNVAGQRIVIFRGDGGREVLGDTLAARGASIEYAECYRRSRPDASAGGLLRQWSRNEINAVTVTSAEGLRNLYDMLGKLGRQWLKTTPVFVPHPRILEVTRELGLEQSMATPSGDEGLVQGMIEWFRIHP